MNPFSAVFRKLTYRNEYSKPDAAAGLDVTGGRWGGRTVHDSLVPVYLQARRERLVCEGLDPLDRALLDRDTIALLARSSRQGLDFHQVAELGHAGRARVHMVARARTVEVRQ
jgi:hypothetical protein